ncbi:hypothetical protein [Shewanella sp. OMA3-2]|uniref:hypothetical protein n=1 Tax=Shewanella sp. OMA3-2 TaxID=2908650 RepID=UPI001F3BFB08|nr:hypothetical protein [Shewanella sp. OMA3-2]UJF20504.1 hypothetical protein L0B17_09760 [Shewanella sp. OMA3-2]
MVGKMALFLLFITSLSNSSSASGLWPDVDINDPNLTVNLAAQQCSKSLMYAPYKLEQWCEKAYNMGSWHSLLYIGYHTGDGSRYVEEAINQVRQGNFEAISELAWIYSTGSFVEIDLNKSIILYNQYLNHENRKSISRGKLNSVHKELYNIYKELENWRKASEHLQFLIEHEDDAIYKSLLIKQMEDIKKTLNSK